MVSTRLFGATKTTTPRERPAPRLLDRVRGEMRIRHYSARTEEAYVHWVRRYVLFHGKRHPNALGEAEIAAFLGHLATAERGRRVDAEPGAECDRLSLSHGAGSPGG
jgi:hypothetical protein